MTTPRRLVVTAAATALAVIAPMTLAESAQAAGPAFSVSVEHCGGGIAVVGYSTLVKARKAESRLVARQKAQPHTLRTVQLRKGSKLIKATTKHC